MFGVIGWVGQKRRGRNSRIRWPNEESSAVLPFLFFFLFFFLCPSRLPPVQIRFFSFPLQQLLLVSLIPPYGRTLQIGFCCASHRDPCTLNPDHNTTLPLSQSQIATNENEDRYGLASEAESFGCIGRSCRTIIGTKVYCSFEHQPHAALRHDRFQFLCSSWS